MPKACSNDLRARVVKAVDAGASCRAAALRYGVAPSSAIKWLARWRERGDVSPGSSRGRIRSPLQAHRQWLLDQVVTTPGLTLAEMRERLLAEQGVAAGINAIWLFFRREGISFKKNAAAIRASQARRREAAGELAALPRPGRG